MNPTIQNLEQNNAPFEKSAFDEEDEEMKDESNNIKVPHNNYIQMGNLSNYS